MAKKDHWLPETAGARPGRRTLRRRSGPRSASAASPIMEFCKQFNAQTREDGKGHADPGRDHGLCGPLVLLRNEDAAGVLLHQEGGQARSGSKAPGRDKAGSITPTQVREIAEQKMKDLNCDSIEFGHEDGRRFRPFDGHRGCGVNAMALGKRTAKAREGVDRTKLYRSTKP